jgi:hypothetical protein
LKIDQTSPAIEPVRLVFCGSTRHVYDAIVEEIAPQSDGTCQVTAKEYRASFYDYDNASYPATLHKTKNSTTRFGGFFVIGRL